MNIVEIKVAEADADIRLDRWFKRHRSHVQHALLEKALRKGQVRLNGKKAKASTRLEEGNILSLPQEWETVPQNARERPRARWQPDPEEAEALRACVLYKDENLLAINKPPGLAVQGGTGQVRNLDVMLDALRFDAKERPRLVHRLDKDTSGVLLLARNSRAATELTKLFAGKQLQKFYHALVIGFPIPNEGRVALPLAKLEQGKHSRTTAVTFEMMGVDMENGQAAETEFRVLDHLSDQLSWVELQPITGRTHQLRVHMAAIGHPVVGDGKYGGSEAFVQGLEISRKLHLHAARVHLPDFYGKKLEISAPLPLHMRQSVETLGIDVS